MKENSSYSQLINIALNSIDHIHELPHTHTYLSI